MARCSGWPRDSTPTVPTSTLPRSRCSSGARSAATGSTGLSLTRQYYLRVVAARDGSPAAQAGLHTGDYIRAIDGKSTRHMSLHEGERLLRGPVGSKVTLTVLRGSQTDTHEVPLDRVAALPADVTHRIAAPGVGLVRDHRVQRPDVRRN